MKKSRSTSLPQDLIGLAGLHIQRMPCIYTRGCRMSTWTDVKEILFPSCSDRQCTIVLDALKQVLNYPASEADLRPCTPREHLTFLRQFRVVPAGTLLVNVDVVCKNMKSLWSHVTSKHSHTNNPHSKQCQYVSSTKGSLAQFDASKNKIEGKHPPKEDVILTFYKFPSQNDKQQGEATLVPAVKQTTNKGDGSSEKKIFLPVSRLSLCLPKLKDKLIELCGNHLIHGPESSKHVLTKCCSAEEGRAITRWFHKVHGWGGVWQHVTSRDLLICWEEFLIHIGQSDEQQYEICEAGAEQNTEVADTITKKQSAESGDYVLDATEGPDSATPVVSTSANEMVSATENGISEMKISPPVRQQKKRLRIKSPEENPKSKTEDTHEENNNNSAVPKTTSSVERPSIAITSTPLNIRPYIPQAQNVRHRRYDPNFTPSYTKSYNFGSGNMFFDPVNARVQQNWHFRPANRPVVPNYNIINKHASNYIGNQIITRPNHVHRHHNPYYAAPVTQQQSSSANSSREKQTTSGIQITSGELCGAADKEIKRTKEKAKSKAEVNEINVLGKYDLLGSIMKTAQVNDKHFKMCAAVPSRDPRIQSSHHQHKNVYPSIPFDARRLSSDGQLPKQVRQISGVVYPDSNSVKEKAILSIVSASPFLQSVDSLKATRNLDVKPTSVETSHTNRNVVANSSRSFTRMTASKNSPRDNRPQIQCNRKSFEKTALLSCSSTSLCIEGKSLTPSSKPMESKSESKLSNKAQKGKAPTKSASDSEMRWKVKWTNLDQLRMKFKKEHCSLKETKESNTRDNVTGNGNEKTCTTSMQNKRNDREKTLSSRTTTIASDKHTVEDVSKIISALKRNPARGNEGRPFVDSVNQPVDGDRKNNSRILKTKNNCLNLVHEQNSNKKEENKNSENKQSSVEKILEDKQRKGKDKIVRNHFIETNDRKCTGKSKNEQSNDIQLSNEDKHSTEALGDTKTQVVKQEVTVKLIRIEAYDTTCQSSVASNDDHPKQSITIDNVKEDNLLKDVHVSLNEEFRMATSEITSNLARLSRYIDESTRGHTEVEKEDTTQINLPNVAHPKKKWMTDFLTESMSDERDVIPDNTVFEDPLSTDDDDDKSNTKSGDNSETGDVDHDHSNNADDTNGSDSEGEQRQTQGAAVEKRCESIAIEKVSSGDNDEMKATSKTNSRKETHSTQSFTKKEKRTHKKKKKRIKTKEDLECDKTERIENGNYKYSKNDQQIADQIFEESEICVDHEEICATTNSNETNEIPEERESPDGYDKTQKSSSFQDTLNNIYSERTNEYRNSRKVKKSNHRRSYRSSRSPINYAEDSDVDNDVHDVGDVMPVDSSHLNQEKKSKKKGKRKGKKKKTSKKFEDDMPCYESSNDNLKTKKQQMKSFIKEQELMFNIIKGKIKKKPLPSIQSDKETSDIVAGMSRMSTENDYVLPVPSLEKENDDANGFFDEARPMPTLEPMDDMIDVVVSTKSERQASKPPLNKTYNVGTDNGNGERKKAKSTGGVKDKTLTSKKKENTRQNISFLPELKKEFLVNAGGCSSNIPGIQMSSAPLPVDGEINVNLHDIGYDANYDEDGKSNGGIIYHPMFVIPYVLMNGYKCVTVTDAVRMFVNCKPRCNIPKAVLQKHKSLSRTFCTWEQVYILDLLYVKRGRTIKTGDMLLRWDILLANYWNVLENVKNNHLSSTKHTLKCRYDIE